MALWGQTAPRHWAMDELALVALGASILVPQPQTKDASPIETEEPALSSGPVMGEAILPFLNHLWGQSSLSLKDKCMFVVG